MSFRAPQITRDAILFGVAIAMLLHQTFLTDKVEAAIVSAATGILLSPIVMRLDEARKRGNGGET